MSCEECTLQKIALPMRDTGERPIYFPFPLVPWKATSSPVPRLSEWELKSMLPPQLVTNGKPVFPGERGLV